MGDKFRSAQRGEARQPVPTPEPPKPTTGEKVPVPPVADKKEKKSPELNFKALNDNFDKFRAESEAKIKELNLRSKALARCIRPNWKKPTANWKTWQDLVATKIPR